MDLTHSLILPAAGLQLLRPQAAPRIICTQSSRGFCDAPCADAAPAWKGSFQDAAIHAEACAVAGQLGATLCDFVPLILPDQIPPRPLKLRRCSLFRIGAGLSEGGAASVVVVCVLVRETLVVRHQVVRVPFQLYLMAGELEVERYGRRALFNSPRLVVSAGAPVTITAGPGCEFIYREHPLTGWLRKSQKERRHD